MKLLFVFASRNELFDIQLPHHEVTTFLAGVGKARSAMMVMNKIMEDRPDMVISIGTAGTFNHKVGDILVCRHFIDRDFYLTYDLLQLECDITVPETPFIGQFHSIVDGIAVKRTDFMDSCGDNFVTEGESHGEDVVDMESFAELQACREMGIPTKSNRVDIGVRVELPAQVFSHLTDELYESKIVYRTEKFEDLVRTFCMNPHGAVVSENTNGIVTVNGHSYEDPAKHTENTNFALLVSKHFSEPFKDSNGYGESIARLSNMLGGGVIVQRFGDLVRGRRSTPSRIADSFVTPTLAATPGDLSLVIPKRILDGIIEMIYALDKIAPGTANDDTLLYGVEVKFYNMEVELDENLEAGYPGLYIIGDGSGVTHSLSHASASGVHVARRILGQ